VADAFLKDRIGFLEMSDVIENCLEKSTFVPNPSYQDFVQSDEQGRKIANNLIK
jgi:1-deoxy-D-xylulose-5-phosphate reductoisomerase